MSCKARLRARALVAVLAIVFGVTSSCVARGDRRPADALGPKWEKEGRRAGQERTREKRGGEKRRQFRREKGKNIFHLIQEIPGLKEERKRFHQERKEIMKGFHVIRQKVHRELREAAQKGERPGPENLENIKAFVRRETEAIVGKLVENRIHHEKRLAAILEKAKPELVEKVTAALMKPPQGGFRRHTKGDRDGRPREGRGRRRGTERPRGEERKTPKEEAAPVW